MTIIPKPCLDEQSVFELLTDQLDLKTSNGLFDIKGNKQIPFNQKREINQASLLGVDAIYFVNGNPIIYFVRLSSDNHNTIRKLQHFIWNQGKVPFLIIISPGQIRIINTQILPTSDDNSIICDKYQIFPSTEDERFAELLNLRSVDQAREVIAKVLAPFTRESIDSENIWKNPYIINAIRNRDRVDRRLLNGLRLVRESLLHDNIPEDVITNLLIRSFLIMYLQDRKAIPEDCYQSINYSGIDYLEVLNSVDETYLLFDSLSKRFNGTVFRVSVHERQIIKKDHLLLLRKMLYGTDIQNGQEPLFRLYRFEHIPIEMISGLYEEFLRYQEYERAGAYYTSPALVKLMLDEAFEWSNVTEQIKILDPACGSGIFLVEAFHRLVDKWRNENPEKRIDAHTLRKIIQSNLYGIDIDQNAINVAAFSLYLALLDNLEPEYIRKRMRKFPTLVGKNLLISDFFNESLPLQEKSFDLIIGNVPWESKLTKEADKYCFKRKLPINDNQIALAFLWRSPDFCSNLGKICLLVSSKAVLFNKGGKDFRSKFLQTYSVSQIFDFSMLRKEKSLMFSQAIGPAAAIFFSTKRPKLSNNISYIVPTISPNMKWIGIPTVDPIDIKKLPLEWLIKNDNLWKMSFWGGPRDFLLIEQLEELPKIHDFLRKYQRVKPQEGYKLAQPRKIKKPELINSDSINSSSKFRYILLKEDVVPLAVCDFYYFKDPEIYKPPLVIIRQSPIEGEIQAFYSDNAVIYPERFVGFPCKDEAIPYLKLLTLYFNSSLASYYYFLTSAEWGIERDNLQLKEHLSLPFLTPNLSDLLNSNSIFSKLLIQFENLCDLRKTFSLSYPEREKEIRHVVDELLFDLFDLSKSQRDLVLDAVNYTIPFFTHPHRGSSIEEPDIYLINEYIETFIETFSKISPSENLKLHGSIVYFNRDTPLIVVGFTTNKEPIPKLDNQNHRKLFSEINNLIIDPRLPLGQSVFSRRHIRYFSGNQFYIIKPKESRLWTKSLARADADGTIGELLQEYSLRKEMGNLE